MAVARPTLLLRLYAMAAGLMAPLAIPGARTKVDEQNIDLDRISEKKGHPTAMRPDGPLLWFHAASVGESLSVLRLISHLGNTHPDLSFLITSGTATSARILGTRLPARCIHQFAPLDSRRYVRRFLRHWRPTAAVFVESELWPNMLGETARAGIPLALINARISDRSFRNWKRLARSSRYLMGLFSLIHCQDQRTADHLHDLGLPDARAGANLKSFSGALPYDADEMARMRSVLQGRPIWLASSTHPGEDEIVLHAHHDLQGRFPGLLLILVPRHPERAADIETAIAQHGLTGVRRSVGGRINGGVQVYLADTLGETGLWYALSPVTCLCGSFTPVGGHNPFEPAYAGSAVLHGPLHANFAGIYAQMDASGGSREVTDARALAAALGALLETPEGLHQMRRQARAFADAQEDALDDIAQDLSKALSLR